MARTRRATRRGAAAVEVAITLPLLAVLAAMILDFARVFHTTQVLDTAAGSGAAYVSGAAADPASATPGRTAACAAGAALVPPLRENQVTISQVGTTVTVTIDYDQPLITGFLYPGGSVSLRRTAVRAVTPAVGQ